MSVRILAIVVFAILLLIPVALHLLLVPAQEARLAERFPHRADSAHLVVWSTMSADETEKLARDGERFFERFNATWRPLTALAPLPGRVSVYILEDHARMVAFYQEARGTEAGTLEHNAGFYDGGRREVVLYGRSASGCHATLIHELTHTLHHPWNVPPWVAEGFAQTVEYTEIGLDALAGEGCWDLLTIGSGSVDESGVFDLGPILSPKADAHLAFSAAGNAVAYGRAVALFSYLLHAPDARIRSRFITALRSASSPQRQLDALALVLGLTSAELQDDFRAYWRAAQDRAIKALAMRELNRGE
jgi:hypothetical protein